MHLIYADRYANARAFARHQELMPGDWTWIRDPAVIRAHPRADIYKAPRWEAHPRRGEIDTALRLAAERHRLGTITDLGRQSVW